MSCGTNPVILAPRHTQAGFDTLKPAWASKAFGEPEACLKCHRPPGRWYAPGRDEGDRSVDSRLIEAVRCGNLQQVRDLLKPEVHVRERDDEGNTLLMTAPAAGHIGIVKLLADAGAELNARNNAGMTALLMAAAVRHMEVLSYLVQRGADLSVTDEEGNTALMIAARTGLAPAVELLLKKHMPVNATNRWGTTALMQAARVGNINVVKTLLDAGADPDFRDVLGKRAITYAQEKGTPPVYLVRMLRGDRSSGGRRPSHASADRPWWRFWEK